MPIAYTVDSAGYKAASVCRRVLSIDKKYSFMTMRVNFSI